MNPSSHTDRDNPGSAPMFCTSTHTTTFAAMNRSVTIGVESVGLSSR